MNDGLGRERNISKEEKERIVKELKEGYKKMAPLNQKLAKKFSLKGEEEAN